MQYTITLTAGEPQRQEFSGQTFVLLDTGASPTIDMALEVLGFAVENFNGVRRGLKIQSPGAEQFTGATFTSAVNTTIQVVVSAANISIGYQDGANVNATIVGPLPLTVSNDRGSLANPVYVNSVTYSDAPAATLQDNAAVAVGGAGAALLAAKSNRKNIRFTNIGTDSVAIGFTGITWANRCIVLDSGDTWVEDRAANMAWAAVTDTGKSASVTTQEVMV